MADQITAADVELAQMLNSNAIGPKEGVQRALRSKAPNQEPVSAAKRKQQEAQGDEDPPKKRGRGRPRKNDSEKASKKPAKSPKSNRVADSDNTKAQEDGQPLGNLKKPTRTRDRPLDVTQANDNIEKDPFDVPDDVPDDAQDVDPKPAKAAENRKQSTKPAGAKPAKDTANKRKPVADPDHEKSLAQAQAALETAAIDELDGNEQQIVPQDDSFVPDPEAENGDEEEAEAELDSELPKETMSAKKKGKQRAVIIEIDSPSGTPTQTENTTDELQLFGRKRDWAMVLEGARTVGVSVQKGKTVSDKPDLVTQIVTDLVSKIQGAITLYKQLGSSEALEPEDIQSEEETLTTAIDEIYEAVDALSESNAGTTAKKQSQTIQDIYAYAIPSLVFLLRAALTCRNHRFSQDDDIVALGEIIKIQDMIRELCLKARQWKAKPITDRPIMGSTSQKIGPYMRDLRKAFGDELERRERAIRQQSYNEAFAESHKRREERLSLAKQVNERNRAKQRVKIMEQYTRTPWQSRVTVPQPMQNEAPMAQMMPPAPNTQIQRGGSVTGPVEWTEAENMELITQLTHRDIRYLPLPDRWLVMLNSPLLQNKLPEHIRERALYYKDILIEQAGPQDYLLSIE